MFGDKEIGGFNELFRGWGGEDDEFSLRARKLAGTGKIVHGDQYDFNLYHLFHNRTTDCTEKQSGYQHNLRELRKVESMGVPELKHYIHVHLAGQGNVDKYRREK